jgi:hypothetical protein
MLLLLVVLATIKHVEESVELCYGNVDLQEAHEGQEEYIVCLELRHYTWILENETSDLAFRLNSGMNVKSAISRLRIRIRHSIN